MVKTTMDYTELTAARNAFIGNPGLCHLLKYIAVETWKRLEFSYLKKQRAPFETTLTQNIVFAIQAFTDQYPELRIRVQEAKDESKNGNDLELLLRFNQEQKEFYAPIQAKKISRRENYITMEHGRQIEQLIAYADASNGLPLYLLFNCIEDPDSLPLRYQAEHYGCTIVPAQLLRDRFYQKRISRKDNVLKWKIPNFKELHDRYALPWHLLACGNSSVLDFFSYGIYSELSEWNARAVGINPIGTAPKFEAKKEVKRFEESGHEIRPEELLNPGHRFPHHEYRENFIYDGFRPKYRISIDIN
jgi:hypothetical protein